MASRRANKYCMMEMPGSGSASKSEQKPLFKKRFRRAFFRKFTDWIGARRCPRTSRVSGVSGCHEALFFISLPQLRLSETFYLLLIWSIRLQGFNQLSQKVGLG